MLTAEPTVSSRAVIGKARWSRGQYVCTSKQELVGSCPAEAHVDFCPDTLKAPSIRSVQYF